MKTYRSVAALVVWFGLLLQYFLMVRGQSGEALATRTINFFSYFTILSNVSAVVALSVAGGWGLRHGGARIGTAARCARPAGAAAGRAAGAALRGGS